jgi:hypothetical protein
MDHSTRHVLLIMIISRNLLIAAARSHAADITFEFSYGLTRENVSASTGLSVQTIHVHVSTGGTRWVTGDSPCRNMTFCD